MKKLRIAAPLAVVAAGVLIYLLSNRKPAVRLVTAPITRGAVVRAVTATGTINPVVTVQVGTYVSGPIQALYADFNSPVKKGQLIAKIDPRPFEVKAEAARAALANARAQLGKDQADAAYKKLVYERNSKLLKAGGVVSQDNVDSALSAYRQATAQVELDRASIAQDQATLREAEINLGYTNIVSPVDGVVISRNVDVGQTVAASFQTPTLFLIGEDMTRMQVDSNVSESDIGGIKSGQQASFTVDAYPEREFRGQVGQVRQAPITVQNVVTYDVVVNVANPELVLRPGMTANLTIVTDRRDNALRIPTAALRFSPRNAAKAAGQDRTLDGEQPGHRRIWVFQGGVVKPVSIVTGLNDGNNLEVLGGPLHEGDEVVTDEVLADKSTPGSTSAFTRIPRLPH